MEIRAEKPEDIAAVRRVNLEAFGRSGEADLVDRLRGIASTFSLVAVESEQMSTQGSEQTSEQGSEQIVGHICFSPVTIAEQCTDDLLLVGLAPVAVLPAYQRRGIGSLLIRQGLATCDRLGCQAVVVLGAPAYYARFGFIPAKEKGLRCDYPVPDEAFMVLELAPGSLQGYGGTIKYRSEFDELA